MFRLEKKIKMLTFFLEHLDEVILNSNEML